MERDDNLFADGVGVWLQQEVYTTPEEKDPSKPLIRRDDRIYPNPDFNPELERKESEQEALERRRENPGTSFFFNFSPDCTAHQLGGEAGDWICHQVTHRLIERFFRVLSEQSPDAPTSAELRSVLEKRVQTHLRRRGDCLCDNGEIYIWIRGIRFREELAFKMLRAMKASLEAEPISITWPPDAVIRSDYVISFYGWGIRYI
ncbi:MAG: hypothetical protein AAB360_04165 [Patescibacteria group bacterium]